MKDYNWIESHNGNRYGRISANCDIRKACAIESMYTQGLADEETGDQETFGYYAFFKSNCRNHEYILEANSQGFIWREEFKGKRIRL